MNVLICTDSVRDRATIVPTLCDKTPHRGLGTIIQPLCPTVALAQAPSKTFLTHILPPATLQPRIPTLAGFTFSANACIGPIFLQFSLGLVAATAAYASPSASDAQPRGRFCQHLSLGSSHEASRPTNYAAELEARCRLRGCKMYLGIPRRELHCTPCDPCSSVFPL